MTTLLDFRAAKTLIDTVPDSLRACLSDIACGYAAQVQAADVQALARLRLVRVVEYIALGPDGTRWPYTHVAVPSMVDAALHAWEMEHLIDIQMLRHPPMKGPDVTPPEEAS